jgi:hypothetical protein
LISTVKTFDDVPIGDPAQPVLSGLVRKPNGEFKPRPRYSLSVTWHAAYEDGTSASVATSVEVGESPAAAGGKPVTNKPDTAVSSPFGKMPVRLDEKVQPGDTAVAAEFQSWS